ncbi:Guard cell S-type anion channel slac1 [Asimina triloba]
MATRPPSPSSNSAHFVDIHQITVEEEEEPRKAAGRPPSIKWKEQRRAAHRNFSRQVSLETGFSALKRESKGGKESQKVLARNGRSFSGFGAVNYRNNAAAAAAEGRKTDFSIFRTKSTLHKQHSLLPVRRDTEGHSKKQTEGGGGGGGGGGEGPGEDYLHPNVPNAGRYFAALRGPELDQVKDSEDILLPKDELWPFLLRFPIGCFGICLGLGSQSILWRNLTLSPVTQFLHIPPLISFFLWNLALLAFLSVSATYLLKCAFYFEAVRREYYHPVRVNFFFAPWIVCMFLAIAAPPAVAPRSALHPAVWCAFMAPVFFLELKIYGQWLSGGKRRLSRVANPSSHLSVVGNFVGAILACKVGWKEPAKFFWAVGVAHYLVVFVTLYQRLPSTEALPKELHPVFCMFIAAPAAASIAWEAIYGEFDAMSRTCYFIALFLFVSLVVRINFFWGFRFSVAWWSYTFPMTTVALATIKYAEQVPCLLSKVLALLLSLMSSTMVTSLLISTFLHAFIWQSLFPNDLAIAITKKRSPAAGGTRTHPTGKTTSSRKKGLDIRRWTKQSPLSLVSSAAKEPALEDNKERNIGIESAAAAAP